MLYKVFSRCRFGFVIRRPTGPVCDPLSKTVCKSAAACFTRGYGHGLDYSAVDILYWFLTALMRRNRNGVSIRAFYISETFLGTDLLLISFNATDKLMLSNKSVWNV